MKTVRIGSGAGYAGDRIEPAIDLMEKGNLDYIIFECLAERTISIAQKRRNENPLLGYNDLLEYRFDKILDVLSHEKVGVVTNMGAANPEAGAKKVMEMAKEKGIEGLKIAWVSGDDVGNHLEDYKEYVTIETNDKLSAIKGEILAANGYIGCKGIVEALNMGADIVITGRVADPSLTLGILVHEYGWDMDDYIRLGRGTAVGHLLECAGQVTGGYFDDCDKKKVSDLWNLGFPIAEVSEDGNCKISKLENVGGIVTIDTVKEQLIYELIDPENYFTPDVVANFANIHLTQVEKNVVLVENASGKEPNHFYKTSVGYHDCYIGIGEISYGGYKCIERANLAAEILKKRFEVTKLNLEETRYDLVGVNSLYGNEISRNINKVTTPTEVRLRVSGRSTNYYDARRVGEEVEALYTNGPFGGGGVDKTVKNIVSIASILVPADEFTIKAHMLEE